jgi:hypothetical protein
MTIKLNITTGQFDILEAGQIVASAATPGDAMRKRSELVHAQVVASGIVMKTVKGWHATAVR